MIDEYFRNAVVMRIIDGDSIEAEIDLGFEKLRTTRIVRLLGINAPEKNTLEGQAAHQHLIWLLPIGTKIVTQTINKRDKYGRYLARVYRDRVLINQLMIDDGFAVATTY